MLRQRIENVISQWLAWIQAMGDVYVARLARVTNEVRRAARHVSRENRCWRVEPDGPPCLAMPRDIPTMYAGGACRFQEALDRAFVLKRQLVQVLRQVDDAPQLRCIGKHSSRRVELPRLGHGREEDAHWKSFGMRSCDPEIVRSRYLTPVNTAQLAELDEPVRDPSGRMRQWDPPTRRIEALSPYRPAALERAELVEPGDALKTDR